MEKYAWTATVIDGKKDEYIKRHDEIWQSMKDVLTAAGIVNYSIWLTGNTLFGYYECKRGAAYAEKVQRESKAVDDWNAYMKDVMIMKMDEKTGAQPKLTQIFSLN